MADHTEATEFLFSYGTLQLEAVQQANFGRLLTGQRDVLPGFAPVLISIDDEVTVRLSGKSQLPIARYTGRPADTISGTVYALTREEIVRADDYEVEPYRRARVTLQSGTQAWAYVDASHMPPDRA
ncbi:MAG: gamma-glutamylcyclotransferase family protein [Gemmatimonadota bacterium]